jgi:hypothetical protein
MNTFLEARHAEAHRRYLDQVAYMNESNLKFAEKEGGVSALTGANKARYEGIQNRLIDLVAYADAAQDYIESLQQAIDDLMQEKKRLRAQLTELSGESPLPPPVPYREYLGIMVLGTRIPVRLGALLDYRDGRRQAVKNSLATQMPQLF